MIKYIIVDDEHMAHEIIKSYSDMLPNMDLVQNCYDAFEAAAFLSKQSVDLMFLDLNMPKLKGFDFLKTLSHPPKVIVTTAYQEYALQGYELNVVDYLLKPFSLERFMQAVNKASLSSTSSIASPLPSSTNTIAKSIYVKSNKKYIQLFIDNIQYIEAAGNYIKVITTKESIMVREKISDFLERLPKELFLRVHKSYVVAVSHIKVVEGNRIMIHNQQVPIGTMYKENIMKLFTQKWKVVFMTFVKLWFWVIFSGKKTLRRPIIFLIFHSFEPV